VKEGSLFEFFHEEGAHLRRGAHHHIGGGFLVRRRLLQRQRQRQGKFKGKKEERQIKGSG
jgi:hypothetical protein